MITITGPLTPASSVVLPPSGPASSEGTVSSFADQLATASSQAGGVSQSGSPAATGIGAAPRQDSDTQPQENYLQIFLRTATASAPAPAGPGIGASAPVQPKASSPSAQGAQDPGPASWLSYPYYTPPPPVYVPVPQPAGVAPAQLPTAETDLQLAASQCVRDPIQFLQASNTPEYASPEAFTANMIAYAQSLCQSSWSPITAAGFDPMAMGTQYAQLVIDTLKRIPVDSSGTRSVYDEWTANPPANSYTQNNVEVNVPAPYDAASMDKLLSV